MFQPFMLIHEIAAKQYFISKAKRKDFAYILISHTMLLLF